MKNIERELLGIEAIRYLFGLGLWNKICQLVAYYRPLLMKLKIAKALIIKAENCLLQRKLKQALELVEIAKEFSANSDYIDGVRQAQILKGKMLSIQAIYHQDQKGFQRAVEYYQQLPYTHEISIQLALGRLYTYQKKFEQARTVLQDTLNKTLNISACEDNTIMSYIYLGNMYFAQYQMEKALTFAKQAQTLIDASTALSIKNVCNRLFMDIYLHMHQFGKAKTYATKLLENSEITGSVEDKIHALSAIGITHSLKRAYKLAIEHFTLTKELSEQIDYRTMVAKCYMHLGNVFMALFNFENALSQYSKVLKRFSQVLDDKNRALVYHNLGGAYLGLERGKEAVASFEKVVSIAKVEKSYKLHTAALYELSSFFAKKKDKAKFLQYGKQLEIVFNSAPITYANEIHLANLSRIAFYQEEYAKAETFALKSLEKCKKGKNLKTQSRVYHLLFDIYKAQANYQKALHFHELYNQSNEAFLREMNRRQTIDLELQYETKEKEKEIELLKAQMAYKELDLEHMKKTMVQNDLIQRANEEIKQFTYAVSHDLKEPLRMIGSFSKLLKRRLKSELDDSTKEYFDYIFGGVQRMEAMLNGLLDYAYIGKHTNLDQKVDLMEIVHDVLLNLKIRIDETNAVIEVMQLPMVISNETLIAQLMQNLIANALKFTPPDVAPKVLISHEEKDEFFVLKVKDNGIGIAPENQQRIFDLFSKVHKRTRYEGTGIGLAMCKKITQIIGGEIWLSSELHHGTTFYFSIPKVMD